MENKNITWLRAIACLMVITIHGAGHYYILTETSTLSLRGLLLQAISRPAVPIFAMISGYLIWNRICQNPGQKAVQNFFKMFTPIIFFGIVYYIYDTFMGLGHYPYLRIILNTDSTGIWKGHLWYLYSLLPIYTLSTFISLPLNKSKAFYRWMFIITALIFFITQSIKYAPFYKTTHYELSLLFLYMLIGFSLGQKPFSSISRGKSLLLYILCSLAIIILDFIDGSRKQLYFHYNSIFVFSQSIFLFYGLLTINIEKISAYNIVDKVLSLISRYSLGIYGWHMLFLPLSRQYWESFSLRGTYVLFLSLPSTLLLSLGAAMIGSFLWKHICQLCKPLTAKISASLNKYFDGLSK